MLAITPIIIADIGSTNPLAGVIATSPATAPLANARLDAFPSFNHDKKHHVNAAAAVAVFVTSHADAARPFDATALPALNPNHPNHSNAVASFICFYICVYA